MSERKTWTLEVGYFSTQQDQILRQLYEDRGIKKWSVISQMMEQSYRIEGRNGKQCRERYHNHLKGGISKQRWTQQEQQQLVDLHSKHGNRWALISKLISGRTQNCVKNMFNSKLRKSVRLLNRFIYLYYRKILKQIKINFVNRLSEFTEAAHKKPEDHRNPQERTAIYLKNQILRQDYYEVHEMSQEQKLSVKTLIEQIHAFKKDNHKYYRGNVMARLRKQKFRLRVSEDNIQLDEQQSTVPRQTESASLNQLEGKLPSRCSSSRRINNIFQQLQLPQSKKQQTQTDKPVQLLTVQRTNSLCRLQSFQNNLSSLLGNDGLERPIQLDSYLPSLTPAPRFDPDFVDWSWLSLI